MDSGSADDRCYKGKTDPRTLLGILYLFLHVSAGRALVTCLNNLYAKCTKSLRKLDDRQKHAWDFC
jgi:hypothetical protein